MKKILLLLNAITLFGLAFYIAFFSEGFYTQIYGNEFNENTVALASEYENIPVKDFVVMTFAGDVMMDRRVESTVHKVFAGDFGQLFGEFDLFQNDDISFINLEGPVSDQGHNVGSIYSFRMDPQVLPVLKNLGVDVVSFANNHIGDYTIKAFIDTLNRLTENNILYTGAGASYDEASMPTVIEQNGIKVCFLAYSDVGPTWLKATEKSAGILLANDPNLVSHVMSAKQSCDVLVVSFHWGEEYQPHNAHQAKIAHLVIDSGADIVVGHHPHVAQDVEIYKGKPIMYSLGNFMFDQYFSKPTMQGLVVQMKVYKNGVVKDIKQFITKQNANFQIESVEEKVETLN